MANQTRVEQRAVTHSTAETTARSSQYWRSARHSLAAIFTQTIFRDRSVRSACFAFVLTRGIVLAIIVLTSHITFSDAGFGPEVRNVHVSLRNANISAKMSALVLGADTNWYLHIARDGYEARPFDSLIQHNWVFFPLYPLLWRAAATITGEYPLTGILISNIFFFCALILLHKTGIVFGLDEGAADRAVFYAASFPTSYFYSVPLTESLFMMLTVASFYAAKRGKWWAAGLAGALASATRVTGVLLLPALAVLYVLDTRWRGQKLGALWLSLVPMGLFAFMFHLYRLTGNPLAFKDANAAWGRAIGFFLIPLWNYLANPLMITTSWDFRLLNFAAGALALVCGVVLLLRRSWSLAIYTLASVFVSLSSLLLQSQARYAMVIFPMFFVLAMAGQRARVDQTIRVLFLTLLALMSAMYAAHFTLALA